MSDEDYDDDFDDDDDTKAAAAPSDKLPSASKSGLGETDQLLQNRNSDHGMNQAGGRGKRGVAGRPNSHPKPSKAASKDGKKKLDAYKRANEKLRAELDKCIDSQYKARELEDQLKSLKEEMRKVSIQNKKLEKMLEKPIGREPNEEDESQMEKIRTLMNDMRLLQDKTRKYKARAQDAERSSQRLTVQLADVQGTNSKQQQQIKQLKKSGMDNKVRKDLEYQLQSANKKAESASRELHMCNKKHTGELKKYRSDAIAANKEAERMRERMERSETELKEVQMEARILSLKLRNDRRDFKAKIHKVKPIDDDSRSMAPTDEAPCSHRTVESAVSKAPSALSKQSSAMSGLEKSVLESIPGVSHQELIRAPTPPVKPVTKDDLSELQNKELNCGQMDALRKRQAKVVADESLKAAQKAADDEQLRQRNAESLAAANDVLDAAAAASDAGAAEEDEQQDIGSDSESEEEEYVDETAQDEDAAEQLSGAASEPQDNGRRGSIQHTTDEGEVYYELTDENGDPTGQTTWRSPEESAADGETAKQEVAAEEEEATEAEELDKEVETEVQAEEAEVQAEEAEVQAEEAEVQAEEAEVQAEEEILVEEEEEVHAEEAEVQAEEEILAEEEEEDGYSDEDDFEPESPTKGTHGEQAVIGNDASYEVEVSPTTNNT